MCFDIKLNGSNQSKMALHVKNRNKHNGKNVSKGKSKKEKDINKDKSDVNKQETKKCCNCGQGHYSKECNKPPRVTQMMKSIMLVIVTS